MVKNGVYCDLSTSKKQYVLRKIFFSIKLIIQHIRHTINSSDVFFLFPLFQFKANLLAFHKESTWRDNDYVPPLEEYLMNSTTSSCICLLGLCIIFGRGHGDTIGACRWATKKPKAVVAAEKMGRIINDIVGNEVRGQS